MFYWPFFLFFWLFYKIFLRLKTFGRENIPRQGGYLIASNHLSNLDPMLLGVASGRKISFMAKDSLFKNRFFAFMLRGVMAFPVKRDTLDISTVKEALQRLKTHGLVVFPQGTRQTGPIIHTEKRKPGLGFLAMKAKVPIVPAFIHGSDQAMPPGSKCVRPAQVMIYFGEPMSFSQQTSYEEIVLQIMEAIKKLSQRLQQYQTS